MRTLKDVTKSEKGGHFLSRGNISSIEWATLILCFESVSNN